MPAPKSDAATLADNCRAMPSGCWEWTGSRTRDGYGCHGRRRDQTLAHRLSHLLNIGPIPHDYDVDHLCGNRACINPAHLEAVPHAINVRRADHKTNHRNRVKTHCLRGHPFDSANTLIERYGEREQRKCRQCRRNAKAERAAARRQTARQRDETIAVEFDAGFRAEAIAARYGVSRAAAYRARDRVREHRIGHKSANRVVGS